MAATETAERRTRKAAAAKSCHLEQRSKGEVGWKWDRIGDSVDARKVEFAGETEARKYVKDHGLIGTFRCVWTGPEFSTVEKKTVSFT